jgi:hypothetical protein
MGTHYADGVEQALGDESFREASVVATPFVRVAITDGMEHPGDIDTGTTAREQQVVVEFVLLRGGSMEGRAFDRKDDGGIISRDEHPSTESICGVLPTKLEALRTHSEADLDIC